MYLGVLGAHGKMNPRYSVLTASTGYHRSNVNGQWDDASGAYRSDPDLKDPYCNGGRGAPGPILPLPAMDEGGNAWIDVRFGPLDVRGDYHIGVWSSALDTASKHGSSKHDFDNARRPLGRHHRHDIGADESTAEKANPHSVLKVSSSPSPTIAGG